MSDSQSDAKTISEIEQTKIKDERLKIWIDLCKFILGTFVIGVMGALINWQIQNKEIERKEMDQLGQYIKQALEENVGIRLRFAQYFSTVTRSKPFRERWKEYTEIVQKEYDNIEKQKQDIEKVKKELEAKKQEGKTDEKKLIEARSQFAELEEQLKVNRKPAIIEQRSRVQVNIYWHQDSLSFDTAMELKKNFEIQGIQTQVKQHLNENPPDAIFIGALVGADEARIVLSAIPYKPEYIYRVDCPQINGGDPTGFFIGIGYISSSDRQNADEKSRPVKISEEQIKSLIEPGISNTEFQIRLRKITLG